MSAYAGFGLVSDAQRVFEASQIECFSNQLFWNSILRANVTHGYCGEALEIYCRMRAMGVSADGFTFPLVIRACAMMGSGKLCRSVHGQVVEMGFQWHLHVLNELMGMYGKIGRMDLARKVFDRMAARNCVSWNTMVSGYALNYDCDGASEMFRLMESAGMEPNLVAWTSLISSHARCGRHIETIELFNAMKMRGIGATAEALAVVLSVCVDLAAFDEGKVFHGYVIKGGYENYLFVKNSLICVYGKLGDVNAAQTLFLEMRIKNIVSWNALITSYAESGLCDEAFAVFSQLEKSDEYQTVRPNVISWSGIIGGFASNGQGKEALELFRRMQLAKVAANSVTITTVLSVCAELAALHLGKEIHGHVIRSLMDASILVGNGLINMYTKSGSFKEGNSVFARIKNRDLISWNTMIAGYGMHGLGENALRTFYQMIEDGFEPDGVSFVAVLSACSHAGLISEGRELFYKMVGEFGFKPHIEHYACIVDLLGRAGLLQEANNVVKSMPMEPNACVWGALLNSCRMHKNTEVAEETASQFFDLNSEIAGSYILLSNIYAASGRWEDSAKVRISAKAKGLKKTCGQSLIEVKKKVYMFSAGNTMRAESESEEIYRILKDIGLHMEVENEEHRPMLPG